ncbi:MAG: hypothetical protein JEZ07_07475, partial [Phycisphaerae bacterium]|nr:hypothetical protein [Phycisphaerae bacterium]
MADANAMVKNPVQNLAEQNRMELANNSLNDCKGLENKGLCQRNKKPAILCEPQEWAIQDLSEFAQSVGSKGVMDSEGVG